MSYYDPFQNQQYMGQPYYPYYPQDGQQATNGNQPPIMQQPQWNYDQQYSEGYPQGAMGSDYYVDESSFNPVPMQLNMPYEASPFPSAPQNPMAQPSDVYGNPQGDNGSPAAPSRTSVIIPITSSQTNSWTTCVRVFSNRSIPYRTSNRA